MVVPSPPGVCRDSTPSADVVGGGGTRSDILQVLRERTRGEHLALERSLELMSATLTLRAYERTLARFYGFWDPLESALASCNALKAVLPDVAQRRRAGLLALDLFDVTGTERLELPRCNALPDVVTVPAALGAMYVLEGATLGGQIILRHLEQTLHLTALHGARFFAGYGEATGRMWRLFGGSLRAFPWTGASEADAVDGARATFQSLHRWCEVGA